MLLLLRLLFARFLVMLLGRGFAARLRQAARGLRAARLRIGGSRHGTAWLRYLLAVGRWRVLRHRRCWALTAARQSLGRFSLIIYRFFFIN